MLKIQLEIKIQIFIK